MSRRTPNAAGCGHRRQYSVDSVQTVGLCTIVTYYKVLFTIVEGSGSVARGWGSSRWAVNSVSSYDGIIRWPFVIR